MNLSLKKQAYGNSGNFFNRDFLLTLFTGGPQTSAVLLTVLCDAYYQSRKCHITSWSLSKDFGFGFVSHPPACLPPYDQPILKAILLGLRGKYHKLILDIMLSSIRLLSTLSSRGIRTLSWNSGNIVWLF